MGVTQQRASKAASELEGLGYVRREADPTDARVRRIALAQRGRDAVAAAREARAAVTAELRARLGARRVSVAERVLREVVSELGAEDAVRARRVRLPR
jgi:DNA-binding MarR family transcriptional regulator